MRCARALKRDLWVCLWHRLIIGGEINMLTAESREQRAESRKARTGMRLEVCPALKRERPILCRYACSFDDLADPATAFWCGCARG